MSVASWRVSVRACHGRGGVVMCPEESQVGCCCLLVSFRRVPSRDQNISAGGYLWSAQGPDHVGSYLAVSLCQVLG